MAYLFGYLYLRFETFIVFIMVTASHYLAANISRSHPKNAIWKFSTLESFFLILQLDFDEIILQVCVSGVQCFKYRISRKFIHSLKSYFSKTFEFSRSHPVLRYTLSKETFTKFWEFTYSLFYYFKGINFRGIIFCGFRRSAKISPEGNLKSLHPRK